ncbi:MAG: superoxide dismutase [Verrucomicrobiota bacterium]|nr:superoxide dismutase [Verrucomicrobiota bacterium]
MQILALEKELKAIDPQQHGVLLREEAACVWGFKKAGIIRDIWFTQRDKTAVVMLECPSEEAAKEHLAMLPLVREGLITFEILPLRSYDGFDRLMDLNRS